MTINSGYIRKFASETYVKAARERGERRFSIPVKPIEGDLRKKGLSVGRTPLVCSALRGKKFQMDNQIVLERWDGPPSGQSPTVVYHFRFADAHEAVLPEETPAQRADRLIGKLRGLLKDEISSFGGTEKFMRWVRSDEDEA